ncbi:MULTISPECIES: SDR family oxidoreductase [unclassified Brevibacterium]|uniref:SDR family oxidoreductase n=1 Tax=unclassified Brevibacterium TaxID=2614124 RepID=UPI001BB18D3E|nr:MULTISPECIES: SDR family oxidoreductase [unclassified Brevibacterium]MCM1013096.1 SDR family oxidoreductase [Brevibacterium sp. XM4083]
MDMFELDDARVLITAGAAGIGRAIAERFRHVGARVWVTDVDEAAATEARGAGLRTTVSNAAAEDEVNALAAEVNAEWGGLDVLVNNAGIAGPTGPVETLESAAWLSTFDVNIHSQFYCIKHFLPLLRKSERPSIVNLSSAAGRLGMAGRSPYSASKWAVVGLTKTLAIELGPEGIRCNAICPGAVGGPRIDGVIAAKAEMLGTTVAEVTELYTGQSSLGKLADADDIGNMAVFLASAMASHVSGQAMAVDGNTEKLY